MTYMSLGYRKLLIYGWALEFCKSLIRKFIGKVAISPVKNLFVTKFCAPNNMQMNRKCSSRQGNEHLTIVKHQRNVVYQVK